MLIITVVLIILVELEKTVWNILDISPGIIRYFRVTWGISLLRAGIFGIDQSVDSKKVY